MNFINELEYINEAENDYNNGHLTKEEYAEIVEIAYEKLICDTMFMQGRTTVESHDHALDQLGGYCWLIRNHRY